MRRPIHLALFVLLLGGNTSAQVSFEFNNSRWANFNCVLDCFSADSAIVEIIVKKKVSGRPPEGLYWIDMAGLPWRSFRVLPTGRFEGEDAALSSTAVSVVKFVGSPFGSVQNDETNLTVVIHPAINPTDILYTFAGTAKSRFKYDFLWTFLQIPATFNKHPSYTFFHSLTADLSNSPDPDYQCPRTQCSGCPSGGPMASYSFNTLQAGLSISDTPLSYSPPRGQSMSLALTYNSQDTQLPVSPAHTNFGPRWSFNWMTYFSEGPVTQRTLGARFLPGGGVERYYNFKDVTPNGAGGFSGRAMAFDPHQSTRAEIRAAASASSIRPDHYEIFNTDGSIEFYDNNAGGSGSLYLTRKVDAQGNTVTLNYEVSSGRLLSVSDALGQSMTFTYGNPLDGMKPTRVTDPFGRFASFTYDAQGRLTSITDPVGIVSSFTYQGSTFFINSMTTPYGTTTFTEQQGADFRIVEATDPLAQTERIEYRDTLAVLPASEPQVPTGLLVNNANLNRFNTFYWDKQAYQAAQAEAPGSAAFYSKAKITHWILGPRGVTGVAASEKMPLESRTWFNYQGQTNPDYLDPLASALATKTARVLDDGSTQLFQRSYNTNGLMTQSIDPLGRQTDYTYNAPLAIPSWNNSIDLVRVSQRNGGADEVLSTASYNTQHLPLTTTDAAGQTTTNTYNAFGQPLTIKNAKNETTTMVYNAQGYLLSTTGALPGSTTSFTYDSAGRVRTATDSEGYTVTNDYDSIDRLTRQTFPDGTFRQTVYDRLSVGSVRDRLGRTTQYTNDGLGRVTQIRDPLNRVINQTWCRCGSLKTLQDGKGNITTWNYDVQGRLTSKVYADGKGDSFLYETSTSRLKSKTDALGQTITYGYTRDNNLASITYTNARNPTPNVSFAYDAVYNRRSSMTDGTGVTTYGYYPVNVALGAGRLQSVAGPLANSTINYTYDQLGRVVGRSINGAANPMSMVYDALGRVTSETNPLGNFTTAYVNTTGRPSSLTYPNGQSTLYSYFNNVGDQRLQQIRNLGPGAALLSQFDYTYDAEGQIATWGQQAAVANSYTLGYDQAGQLTSAALAGATPKNFGYIYDTAGNRINETISGAANPVTVNPLNELVSRTGANARAFAYDANGNMISNNGTSRISTNYTYQWDAENRLVAINYPTTNLRTEFTYDGLGRRVKIVDKTGSVVNATRQFVWDGLSMAEERDGTGSLTKRFYRQGQINGLIPLFFSRDHLGSVREVLNATGALQARYEYDPHGRRTLASGADVTDFAFTGHYLHRQSQLHIAPYREFNADTGTWLSRDPLGEAGGIVLHGYVDNSPVQYKDAIGLKRCSDWTPVYMWPSVLTTMPTRVGASKWFVGGADVAEMADFHHGIAGGLPFIYQVTCSYWRTIVYERSIVTVTTFVLTRACDRLCPNGTFFETKTEQRRSSETYRFSKTESLEKQFTTPTPILPLLGCTLRKPGD